MIQVYLSQNKLDKCRAIQLYDDGRSPRPVDFQYLPDGLTPDPAVCHSSIIKRFNQGELIEEIAYPNEMYPLGPTPEELLAQAKTNKVMAIDMRTTELLALGFTFDSQQFSMTETAQRTWVSLGTALSLGMLTFPLQISTTNDLPYNLATSQALLQFLGTYMLFQSGPTFPLSKGRVLKARVSVCTTVEEVAAIIDDR